MEKAHNAAPKRRIVLVHWKNSGGNIEVFSNLKTFCQSYPMYNYHTLNRYLSNGKKRFEDESMKIERKPVNSTAKPNLSKRFFWEFDFDQIDWKKGYITIIQRIIERGDKEHWQELIRFYGEEKVTQTIKYEINFLPDEIMEEACDYFNFKLQDLKCYKRKQSLPKLWL